MNTIEEQILPYPYTFLPARAVKEGGMVRWYDIDSGEELPLILGWGDLTCKKK